MFPFFLVKLLSFENWPQNMVHSCWGIDLIKIRSVLDVSTSQNPKLSLIIWHVSLQVKAKLIHKEELW